MNNFLQDVTESLAKSHKSIPSKYFYDEKGSRIFQEIMTLEAYYLPRCEMEILEQSAAAILSHFNDQNMDFIDLGAGDGSKMISFLRQVHHKLNAPSYIPMDISPEILKVNQNLIQNAIPNLDILAIPGDYFVSTHQIKQRPNPMVVMYMGSNIGNFRLEEAVEFLRFINDFLNKGDFLLMGVDLKKDPSTIQAAYNDKEGVTKKFNLNLLERINRELGANFNLDLFDHYGTYNPSSGEAQSYLISLEEQLISIAEKKYHFEKFETIHTEISRKFSLVELNDMGHESGFTWNKHFLDSKAFFSLSLFRK
ncbi:L-histidine N(alpha)-methyltransferase [Belliella sp. DSM 111904]|uniref:L-histidine N(Alpha)-methyltransferase n=1 Tax=Belliella filtrata TaxID=2923435 RepID=A0ABS9V3Q4_9BACT|nr:L-histidine N(alpha)-methyltransferase [Belliella filtrata]MCH7410603.1 L-histidine N(alpha)-methyltransferase [Belliella filtrata]